MTRNIKVTEGLMNGTQGTIVAFTYERGNSPNHEVLERRMPACIVIEVPGSTGPAFFDEPHQRCWIPIFPDRRLDEQNVVARTQFALVLGWAMTPWKAQGMILRSIEV